MNELHERHELKQLLELPVRNYKDRVFRMLFKDKKRALELYNALNCTTYTNVEDLTITTLENAVYLGMKNDVSFLLYDRLMLYEHQATKNPNMPLRDLFYVACVYSRLTADKNLYSSALVKLPEPIFLVFYNGKESMPERELLSLSDAYEHPTDNPALELKVQVLNINPGFNEELKDRSKTLYEYMIFVDAVRNHSKSLPFPEAMEAAIEECIRNDILADFLRANKAEVKKVGIFEYDEEKHLAMEREEAEERGRKEGRKEGIAEGEKLGREQGEKLGRELGLELGEKRMEHLLSELFRSGKMEEAKKAVADKAFRDELYKKYNIS